MSRTACISAGACHFPAHNSAPLCIGFFFLIFSIFPHGGTRWSPGCPCFTLESVSSNQTLRSAASPGALIAFDWLKVAT